MSSSGMEIKPNKRSSNAEPGCRKPKKVKPASNTGAIASSPNNKDRVKQVGAFPFMRLPTELQSMILDTAIHEAKKRRRRHVGNILCVSRRFYELAMPHLFRAFTGPSNRSLERLRDILGAHPALAQYLRNLDNTGLPYIQFISDTFLELVEAIRAAFRTLPCTHHRLDELTLACPMDKYREVVDVCRLFEAGHLALKAYRRWWTDLKPTFATLVDKDSLSEGWLMRLTILHLDSFEIDMVTADVLSRLPSLTKLVLTHCNKGFLLSKKPEVIRVLLCTGETSGNLRTLLVHSRNTEDRLRFQREVGVCITNVPIEITTIRRRDTTSPSSATVVTRGCQDLFTMGDYEQLLFLSGSSCTRCPQCCPHTSESDRSRRALPISEVIEAQKERSSEPDSGSTRGPYPYNLCQKHHAETYLQDSDSAFLRRRALECMRWIPFFYNWFEHDPSCLVKECY